mmetsp:Transcript_56631/g.162496  ORF Transcript_56631/g.162496 Transcript_56631/m.162496 type:complete len:201 (-) Transcript_56631:14-616(-)
MLGCQCLEVPQLPDGKALILPLEEASLKFLVRLAEKSVNSVGAICEQKASRSQGLRTYREESLATLWQINMQHVDVDRHIELATSFTLRLHALQHIQPSQRPHPGGHLGPRVGRVDGHGLGIVEGTVRGLHEEVPPGGGEVRGVLPSAARNLQQSQRRALLLGRQCFAQDVPDRSLVPLEGGCRARHLGRMRRAWMAALR